jgi:glycosyltransferase involved in cell wall biosynthesis
MDKLTIVINTFNEENNIETALKSVKDLGPIVIVDMHSEDSTVAIAKKYTPLIYYHERTGYVEPAREFAVSKADTEWVFVLDSDEEVSDGLRETIRNIVNGTYHTGDDVTHFFIPRKTIIFGEWMHNSGWWPDEKIRLFKKGKVKWPTKIHGELETSGEGVHLPPEEQNAIIHHHYTTVSQWIERMDRYTTVQAKEKREEGYMFDWKDLIRKPLSEFLRRFFVWEGWKDGVLGLGICLMQALSEGIVYMKVREMQINDGIPVQNNPENFIQEIGEEFDNSETETGYYLEKLGLQSQLKRWLQKVLP